MTPEPIRQNRRRCTPVLVWRFSQVGQADFRANPSSASLIASADSGSWTITVTMTNGITCLVASGQAFEELAEMLPPKGDPA